MYETRRVISANSVIVIIRKKNILNNSDMKQK